LNPNADTGKIVDTRVILLHCDEPSLPRVRSALHSANGFGGKWDVVEIHGFHPMDRALNRMLECADRDFHVQVDADMVLRPDSITTLRETIAASSTTTWQVCLPLWDTLFDRAILGVKIYRSAVARRFIYHRTLHCEIDQINRALKSGYNASAPDDTDAWPRSRVLGDHVVLTPEVAFWNCYDRSMRNVYFGTLGWIIPYFREFSLRWLNGGNELHLFGLAGLVSGLCASKAESLREKDTTRPPWQLDRARDFFDELIARDSSSAVSRNGIHDIGGLIDTLHAWIDLAASHSDLRTRAHGLLQERICLDVAT
jgi:hypothetical protein